MHLRRQSFTDPATPSIEPGPHSGRGTARREEHDGLHVDRRNVIAVTKGKKIDSAPLSEEKTDLVSVGRMQVMARSGNDASEHEESWEPDGGTFDELAAEPVAPVGRTPAGRNNVVLGVAVGLAVFLAFSWRK